MYSYRQICSARRILASWRQELAGVVRNASHPRPLMQRVAVRMMLANMKHSYDLMMRLQILEGAAGVPRGTWWESGASGLKKATAHFAESPNLHPAWLAERSTTVVDVAAAAIGTEMRRFRLPLEMRKNLAETPFDIVHNALMGMRIDPSDRTPVSTFIFRAAGSDFSTKILDGIETPKTIAQGPVQSWLKRKVQNEVRHFLSQLPIDEKGRTLDVARKPGEKNPQNPDGEERTFASMVFEAMMDYKNDKLGKRLIATWRKGITGDTRKLVMDKWLKVFLRTGKFYPKNKLAEEFDISEGMAGKHVRNGIIEAMDAIWGNKALMDALSDRAELTGIEVDLSTKPSKSDVFPKRKRARRNPLENVNQAQKYDAIKVVRKAWEITTSDDSRRTVQA